MKTRLFVLALTVLVVLSIFTVAGCLPRAEDDPGNGDPIGDDPIIDDPGGDPEPGETMTLTLYFRNRSFEPGVSTPEELLVPVTRQVRKTLSVARAAILELIKGPTPEEGDVHDAGTVIRSDAEVLDLLLADGLLVVDLRYEDPFHPSLALHHEELAFVQSFVTTLTEFPTVDTVWVFRDGRPWSDGVLGWSSPLARRGEDMEFTLYFGDEDAAMEWSPGEWGFVKPVTVAISSPPATIWENCPFARIIDLLTRDHDSGLVATLPAGNTVAADMGFEFDLSTRILTINLQGEATMGHQATQMLLESLVYTFTEIPVIDGVLATLNGDVWHDFHVVWEEPILREELLARRVN